MELTKVKGIGAKTAEQYHKLGIDTAEDLIRHYPRGYDFYKKPVRVSDAKEGEAVSLLLTIVGQGSGTRFGKRSLVHFKAADETGEVRLTFFNMPYLRSILKPKNRYVFRGFLKTNMRGGKYMEQPQMFSPESYADLEERLLPRYGLTQGLKNASVMKHIRRALTEVLPVPEYLSEEDRKENGLIEETKAYSLIHFPATEEEAALARNRLVFDEFFFFLYTLQKEKKQVEKRKNPRPMMEVAETKRLIERLPFALTKDQQKAWEEIRSDLTGPYVMNRLLQGDVGSGKTILAFLALFLCACNGRQGALMVPTEVLAEQHMAALKDLIRENDLPVRPVLLTGSLSAAAKKRIQEEIASGEADIIIGTHALIQEKVRYHDLSLVITDEQHRFGVRQRKALSDKGEEMPVLVMSATPIPRTLAIILYGDLDLTVLKTMPKDRLPIKNLALSQRDREKALRFLYQRISEKKQAYIICPAIEEGELSDLENVQDYTEKIRTLFPPSVRIASLNGKMKAQEKNRIMTAFAAGEIDILVSTTVIEVGINVPNATTILIENAERFGLSQLHQLRGRVGRGKDQSYCIFLYHDKLEKAPKRLEVLVNSTDGFHIAEEDLKLRGPGELFGVRQSGALGFLLADIYEDADLLKKAQKQAEKAFSSGQEVNAPFENAVDLSSI